MALFTPGFKRHLGSTLSELLDKQDSQRAAADKLKGLLGKTGVELQTELRKIFNEIATKADGTGRFNEEAWKKLDAMLNYVAGFDQAVFKKLAEIRQMSGNIQAKRTKLIELLKSRRFAELCEDRMAYSSKKQIEDIIKEVAKNSADTAGTRARQHSVGDWGQFGVMFVELLSDLVKMTLVQKGYDVPEESEKVSGGPAPYLTLPPKPGK